MFCSVDGLPLGSVGRYYALIVAHLLRPPTLTLFYHFHP